MPGSRRFQILVLRRAARSTPAGLQSRGPASDHATVAISSRMQPRLFRVTGLDVVLYASAALALTVLSIAVSRFDPIYALIVALGALVGVVFLSWRRYDLTLLAVGLYIMLADGYLKLRF